MIMGLKLTIISIMNQSYEQESKNISFKNKEKLLLSSYLKL